MTSLTLEQYQALIQLPVDLLSFEQEEALRKYEEDNNLTIDGDLPTTPKLSDVVEMVKDASPIDDFSNKKNGANTLSELMVLKERVRSQLLPEFEDELVADFQLVASVAESFAEDRVHTVAYEVPTALQKQFNNTNAYLSFKSIITDDLSSREVKAEQAKKNWATVCTNYTIQSTGKFRNTEADKQLKVGSQIITYSTALKYEHNPDNFLGLVDVKFKVESLEGKQQKVDAWLDIDIDEARMQQKRWYLNHKDAILSSLDDMDQYKPARLIKEKFERYKLLLAIAKVWGEDHFNNVKAVINKLAMTNGKTVNEKFAEALKKAIYDLQSNFVTPLENLPSDSLIEKLKDNNFSSSRQTLPTYLKDIGVEATARHQISFFSNAVQGYKLSVLEQALQPFENLNKIA
ncbi:hypothetical protein [Acinetobacter lactucae]|uniref:hypothetical protein n=1 Tax=Acinetobacter lactucae TaxID=1785128 RepID=UPI0034D31CFE